MSAAELDEFFVHTVTLAPVAGVGAYGDVHNPPVTVVCLVDEQTRLVRDPQGAEVVSTATVYAAPDAVDGPPGSRVTLPSGRTGVVITQARRTAPGLDLPEHTEWTVT